MNNEIRKNSFIGLNVGNEAFAINGVESDDYYRGLTYLCNYNSSNKEIDFYIPNTQFADIIREWQCEITASIEPLGAAGNVFANTGSETDHDFGNHGDLPIWYFYHLGEQPNNTSGITNSVLAQQYYCQQEFCLHPCLEETDLESAIDTYHWFKDEFDSAILLEEDTLASIALSNLDSIVSNIVLYHELDTLSFNRDSLRAWYSRTNSIAGQLLLASNFIDTDDYADAIEVVDSILSQYTLNAFQTLDLNRLKFIYSAMNSRSIDAFTTIEMDSVELYSSKVGASAAIAKSILYLLDTITTPMYYIPNEISPRSESTEFSLFRSQEIKVYPNPVNQTFFVDLGRFFDPMNLKLISIFDLQGREIYTQELKVQIDEVHLSSFNSSSSILYYRVYDKNHTSLYSGVLFKN